MKKRLFLFVLIAVIAAGALFAWEPEDLTKFPSCMDGKSWLINVGIGFGAYGYVYMPTHVTLDKNLAIGEKQLPFFVGGAIGYSWMSYHKIALGGRFGYHFNWGVDKLDTYAAVTAGWVIHASRSSSYNYGYSSVGLPFLGLKFGARYFFTDFFGVWAEVGYTTFSIMDIGVSFKF